jgi:filamentous hemagglutinin family protein
LLLGALLNISHAQITLDGSLGPPGALTGPNYVIPAEVGQTRGGNLFHSFGLFNVLTNQSGTFTGPNSISNIISRVTGGQLSTIDGLLRSEIPGANLFLINPAGVLFGPNASLDVKGSFHVSTADVLRLADGGAFFADVNAPSVLTTAPPVAFGFLSPTPAGITIRESVLEVPEGRSLSVVGGDVEIVGGPVGLLRARSGRIGIVSVGSPGDVTFDAAAQMPDINLASFTQLGRIHLSDEAFLTTTGSPTGLGGNGTVLIRGGRLVMTGTSAISANSVGNVDGARVGIDVRISGDVVVDDSIVETRSLGAGRGGDLVLSGTTIALQNGGVQTETVASARGGDLTLTAGRLTLISGGGLGTNATGTGPGGALTISATDSVSIVGGGPGGRSRIFSFTDSSGAGGAVTIAAPTVTSDQGVVLARTRGSGNAGTIRLDVDRLNISGPEGTFGGFSSGLGRAADVTVNARESVSVAQRAFLNSTVASTASGTAGKVTITSPTVLVDGGFVGGLATSGAAAGDVELRARTVALTAGGLIATGTGSAGDGGTITIRGLEAGQPSELVALSGRNETFRSGITSETSGSGNAGRISIFTRRLMSDDGTIATNTFSAGQGGDIDVNVGTMTLQGGSFLSSSTNAAGNAGSVTIRATEAIGISSGSIVGAFSLGSGAPGRLSISAPTFSVSGGAGLATLTTGPGRGGDVTIDVGKLSLSRAFIDSSTGGSGLGGNIDIRAGTVDLNDGTAVSASSTSSGNAGNIRISAQEKFVSRNSSVTTEARQSDGGNIDIRAGSLFHLSRSDITTSVSTGNGRGGNISIDPQFVILDRSQIRADALGGPGGNVTIVADVFLKSPDSIVSASSALGVPGTINIEATFTNVTGTFAQLPATPLQATELLRASCAARFGGGKTSSLVVGGRDGLPLEPGGFMPSPLYRLADQSSPGAIQESVQPKAHGFTSNFLAGKPAFSINSRCSN